MDNKKQIKKLREKMEKIQDGKRYEHTVGVEYTAACLAMRYGCDVDAARIAGILHDCAKCLEDEKRISICEKNDIIITGIERKNPFLLHAKVGAFLASEKYGIQDVDILNAIKFHTTGRENMSLLEKIIFIADYIEPNRKQAPNLEEIRKEAFSNLDLALLHILDDTLEYLYNSGGDVDPMTEITRQYYKKVNEGKIKVESNTDETLEKEKVGWKIWNHWK